MNKHLLKKIQENSKEDSYAWLLATRPLKKKGGFYNHNDYIAQYDNENKSNSVEQNGPKLIRKK